MIQLGEILFLDKQYQEKCISIGMINECSLVCSCPTDFKPTHHKNLGKRVLYR